MARRGILLTFAAVVAALGTLLVFIYVKGADARANVVYDTVQVLRVVKVIAPGETVEEAAAGGKFQLGPVPQNQLLTGSMTDTSSLAGKVSTTTLYPGEQVIASKFGGAAESNVLPIPKGMVAISVTLTDPARVAGFVSPGAEVSVFLTGEDPAKGPFARMLLPRVTIIGVGSTAPGSTTTTAEDGTATTEVLPNTLITLGVSEDDAERVLFAVANGEISFGLLTKDSTVTKGPGIHSSDLFQ